MGLTNTTLCIFCNNDRDSIHHFFWNCFHIQHFWNSLEKIFNEKCENAFNIRISQNVVLFGFDKNLKTDSVFNFIILYAKMYIYKCKIEKCLPNISAYLRQLTLRYKIENHNAKISDDLSKFNIEWHYYKPLLFLTDNECM